METRGGTKQKRKSKTDWSDPVARRDYFRAHYQRNKERVSKYRKEWERKNRERHLAGRRKWYQKHKERLHKEQAEYRGENREVLRIRTRDWHRNNADASRWHSMKKKHGPAATKEWYQAQEQRQNHLCAICRGPRNRKYFDIDHNHSTEELRGLLCTPCNVGLGNFKDSPEMLQRAIVYLHEYGFGPNWRDQKKEVT